LIPDIYDRTSNPREIYSLESVVRPGNSGGPVLTGNGEVVGVVFARAENDENLGYAMTMKELEPVAELAGAATDRVSTGDCVG
jgi:S1-C subfamily serine protease